MSHRSNFEDGTGSKLTIKVPANHANKTRMRPERKASAPNGGSDLGVEEFDFTSEIRVDERDSREVFCMLPAEVCVVGRLLTSTRVLTRTCRNLSPFLLLPWVRKKRRPQAAASKETNCFSAIRTSTARRIAFASARCRLAAFDRAACQCRC